MYKQELDGEEISFNLQRRYCRYHRGDENLTAAILQKREFLEPLGPKVGYARP